MKLENDRLCVEISELGAEVTRIFDKKNHTELLWNGDARYWKRRSPVLFPNVGKTWHNTVSIGGTHYPISQHGFARDSAFKCIREKRDQASFLLVSTEETKEVYPFEFELVITYTLEETSLTVEWEVRNPGDEEMYFTIGGHPAFCFADAGDAKTGYMLKFPGKDALEYILIDRKELAADTENVYRLDLEDGCLPLTEEMFENDALIFDNGQISEVWLCRRDGTPRVGMECEGFPNFGVWSVKDAPFVCLEPWMGRCDDVGFDRDISEKPNINKAAPGESFRKSYRIVVR